MTAEPGHFSSLQHQGTSVSRDVTVACSWTQTESKSLWTSALSRRWELESFVSFSGHWPVNCGLRLLETMLLAYYNIWETFATRIECNCICYFIATECFYDFSIQSLHGYHFSRIFCIASLSIIAKRLHSFCLAVVPKFSFFSTKYSKQFCVFQVCWMHYRTFPLSAIHRTR